MNPLSRNLNQIVLFAGLVVLTASCSSRKMAHRSGTVLLISKGWDPATKGFIEVPLLKKGKLWYRDSLVIMEAVRTHQDRDASGKTTFQHFTDGYIFLDLRTRWFSEYPVFSDTSQSVKIYTQADTTLILGGWNFYGPRAWEVLEPLTDMADTAIEGIKYSRVLFYAKYPTDTLQQIAYLRCDRKGTLFHLHKDFITHKGCPAVRIDGVSTAKYPYPLSWTIEFTRDQLTPQEEKIFDAWERNTRNGMKEEGRR